MAKKLDYRDVEELAATILGIEKSTFTVMNPYDPINAFASTRGQPLATVADFTFIHKNNIDMLRMRLREHLADILVLVDTNETHSGYFPKSYVFDLLPERAASEFDCNAKSGSPLGSRALIYKDFFRIRRHAKRGKQSLAFFSTIRRSKNALEARFRAPNSLIY